MTTETLNRPVKYAALEWRNSQGESFEAIQEGALCYLKGDEKPYTGKAIELYENGNVSLEGEFKKARHMARKRGGLKMATRIRW